MNEDYAAHVFRVERMPFDGPAGVLMQTTDAGEAQQLTDSSEPAIFFVNVRHPLRRFELRAVHGTHNRYQVLV